MKNTHLMMAQALATEAGATKRQVQYWSDHNVLLCLLQTDRRGRGRQRLYEASEIWPATVASHLAGIGLPIGQLMVLVLRARALKPYAPISLDLGAVTIKMDFTQPRH